MEFGLRVCQVFSTGITTAKVSVHPPHPRHVAEPSLGFHEKMPYSYGTMRSIYHIREYNFRRLALVRLIDLFTLYWRLNTRHLALETPNFPVARLAGVYRTPWESGGFTTTEAILQG